MLEILLSPPIAIIFFFLLALGLYGIGVKLAANGEYHSDKYLPYTGGEGLPLPEKHVSYAAFFRLALMFGILHVAGLVISTLPSTFEFYWVALFYLLGVGVSILVLADMS
ncbi:MAG: hypothetical protein ABIG43_01880 [Chloroflexota bacterium]